MRVLCFGRHYVIGEVRPSGFGLWAKNGILPIATYPESLDGWNLVVEHFLRLGDRPLPFASQQRTAIRRVG
jgi:hypothetical protein